MLEIMQSADLFINLLIASYVINYWTKIDMSPNRVQCTSPTYCKHRVSVPDLPLTDTQLIRFHKRDQPYAFENMINDTKGQQIDTEQQNWSISKFTENAFTTVCYQCFKMINHYLSVLFSVRASARQQCMFRSNKHLLLCPIRLLCKYCHVLVLSLSSPD